MEVFHKTNLFFHQPEFVFRNKNENTISFQDDSGLSIYFTETSHALTSLSKSPFGGIAFPNRYNDQVNNWSSLFEKIDKYCEEKGIPTVVVTGCPIIYQPELGEMAIQRFLDAGYSILFRDITQVLKISSDPPAFNSLRKRCLRHCIISGFSFKELTVAELYNAYPLFVECREKKGYPITMGLDDLIAAFVKFPEQYKLMGVYDGPTLIAACIVVWVSPSILYYFYVGDSLNYRKHSPVTFLIKGIYDYAKSKGASILDMGISTDHGELNAGLYAFKKSLGTFDSWKFTWVKNMKL